MSMETSVPSIIDADFAVICKGDSMINARIFDGDIVYIRQQEEVENGEIAAVLVGDAVHLGRIWNQADGFMLQPENPAYKSQIFYRGQDNARIIGKAVGASITIV